MTAMVAMAAAAKLPCEIMDDIIHRVVNQEAAINLAHLDRDIDALIRPFAGDEGPRRTAEDEAMKINKFYLSIGDTVRSNVLMSRSTGRISSRHHKVRHLEIHIANLNLRPKAGCVVYNDYCMHFDKATTHIFSMLNKHFPALSTLHFTVDNKEHFCGDDELYPFPGDKIKIWSPGVINSYIEQKLSMLNCLNAFGAVQIPRIKKKTLTFVQNENVQEHRSFDGVQFNHPQRGSTGARNMRFGFMFCALFSEPVKRFLDKTNTWKLSKADVEKEMQEASAWHDITVIEDMLQWPRAAVNFPCGQTKLDYVSRSHQLK